MRNFTRPLVLVMMAVVASSVALLCQSSPTETGEQVYRIGGDVKPPHQIYGPAAEYTDRARKEHQEGVVVLEMVVGTSGLPRDIKVSHSLSPDLDATAIDAVRKWRFSPATKDGEAVAVQISAQISFSLGNHDKHPSPSVDRSQGMDKACRQGGGVKPPQATYMPDPVFSEEEKLHEGANHKGVVILSLIVSQEGRPKGVKVIRSLAPYLDKKAIETVYTWKFDPASQDCRPIAGQMSVQINFANN